MKTLKDEIIAHENCNFLSSNATSAGNNQIEMDSSLYGTTHGLLNQSFTPTCLFCKKDHFADQCTEIAEFDKRKEFAYKNKLCYRCLKKGHKIPKCLSSKKCRKFKSKSHLCLQR